MLNFDTLPDLSSRQPVIRHQVTVPVVQERVSVTPLVTPQAEPAVPASASSFVWEQVRDYVIARILELHGPFSRDQRHENTIFMGFADRWDGHAMEIARYAFEEAKGEWMGAPVGVHRFHKTSDGVFARAIVAELS